MREKKVVENWDVYGLEESVRGAKFPMSADTDKIISAEELEFWLQDDFLPKFIAHIESHKYPKFVIEDYCVKMLVRTKDGLDKEVLVDEEDVPSIYKHDWHLDKYCRSNDVGLLHRFVMKEYLREDDGMVVDHINGDTSDNRKANLRIATMSDNAYNAVIRKNNKSGVMGVCWNPRKNKWKAYINNYGKQMHIGYYDNFDDAVKARLQSEKDICGGFAPQRNLFGEYGIEDETPRGVQKTFCRLKDAIAAYKNISRLSGSGLGEGHDQALTGVIVQFDLTFTIKAWTEAQRYHFLDFVSSQSTMHRITKFDLDGAYDPHTDPRCIAVVKELVEKYNENPSSENYLNILMSNPCGMRLTARMTTNYRQLKTIYRQRKDHRLTEWRMFCRWIEELPHAELITGKENG